LNLFLGISDHADLPSLRRFSQSFDGVFDSPGSRQPCFLLFSKYVMFSYEPTYANNGYWFVKNFWNCIGG